MHVHSSPDVAVHRTCTSRLTRTLCGWATHNPDTTTVPKLAHGGGGGGGARHAAHCFSASELVDLDDSADEEEGVGSSAGVDADTEEASGDDRGGYMDMIPGLAMIGEAAVDSYRQSVHLDVCNAMHAHTHARTHAHTHTHACTPHSYTSHCHLAHASHLSLSVTYTHVHNDDRTPTITTTQTLTPSPPPPSPPLPSPPPPWPPTDRPTDRPNPRGLGGAV
jgi:hypothetical protein